MEYRREETADLRHYLRIVWRYKLLVLLTVIVITGAVLAVSLLQSPVYKAVSRVMVVGQSPAQVLATGQDTGTAVDERYVSTLAGFVVSTRVARRVAEREGVDEPARELLRHVEATASAAANVIEIAAESRSADTARRIANEFAREFVDVRRQTLVGSLNDALSLLESQLAELGATQSGTQAYDELIARRNQLEVLAALTPADVQIGEPASTPTEPVRPRPLLYTGLALAGALVLGLSGAFLRNSLDVRIHSVEQLRGLTDAPVIATITRLPRNHRDGDERRLPTLDDPSSPAAEGFRVLRTSLEFLNFDDTMKSILVTSPLPKEGKTTTIANLAVSLVRTGKAVVLIEGDLRRPSLHLHFDALNAIGVTSVLSGSINLEEALQAISFNGTGYQTPVARQERRILAAVGKAQGNPTRLALLASGPVPPNPGEMVASQRFATILASATSMADYVLIDAPPIVGLSDAAALARLVDGIIVVVRLSETTRGMLQEVETFRSQVKTRLLGIVVTDVPESSSYARYGYDRS